MVWAFIRLKRCALVVRLEIEVDAVWRWPDRVRSAAPAGGDGAIHANRVRPRRSYNYAAVTEIRPSKGNRPVRYLA
jgi:hypothetical protein